MRTPTLFLVAATLLSACGNEQEANTPASADTQSQATLQTPSDHSAHWLQPDVLLVKKAETAKHVRLHYSLNADIQLDENTIALNNSPYIDLTATEATLPSYLSEGYAAYKPADKIKENALKIMLKGQLVAIQHDASGNIIAASQVQRAKLIDAVYTSGNNDADEVSDLGATVNDKGVQFKLWAPTAREVKVLLFDKNLKPQTPASLTMTIDPATGVWSAQGGSDLNRTFYQYKLTVYHPATQKVENLVTTDPYSLSLSTNSTHTQVVDLNDKDTKPASWDTQNILALENYEDSILYELHIRDFSAVDKAISNKDFRGKYKAFSEKSSDGIKHLKAMKEAGLTHIHLLPTFDIGTVNEDPSQTIYQHDTLEKICALVPKNPICEGEYDPSWTLQALLESYSPRSGDAQEVIESMRERDPYNWGYDPYHYTVPEGSYALNPQGVSRILEFREMVTAIHGMGFRVIMDVVYNHTFQARLGEKSVLDKIVPDYYHRLNLTTGDIEQSTCCDNTATENVMMGKLMADSLEIWAKDYKIDGFRFDLMGHQPKDIMLEAYNRVRKIDPDNYFYGEGWNFGEVANNRLFVQSIQTELGGTEIGTFTDRNRDAIRGGRPFHGGKEIRAGQGISNGLVTIPNELQPEDLNRAAYDLSMDQIRVGIAGNLSNFPIENAAGEKVTGKDIPYGDAPTGYALDPADTTNYVSKHDNQTLWDNNQYRIPYNTSTDDRVRMQNLAIAYPMLSQGVPFIHMGSELLRSKSFLRDSYDYNDWFNAVDFGMQSNNYDVGLPPAVKDKDNWPVISELLEKNEGRDHVSPKHIRFAADIFMEWLQIRSGSSLFRLTNEKDIIDRVSFHNTGKDQQLGIIAMEISDEGFDKDIDKNYKSIFVVFNNSGETQTFASPKAKGYALHPVQAKGVDKQLKTIAKANNTGFVVPALSAAVFVK